MKIGDTLEYYNETDGVTSIFICIAEKKEDLYAVLKCTHCKVATVLDPDSPTIRGSHAYHICKVIHETF